MISFTIGLAIASVFLGDPPSVVRPRLESYLPDLGEWRSVDDYGPRPFVEGGMTADLGQTPPQVAMSGFDGNRLIYVSLSYNWIWLSDNGQRRPIWFARLRAVNGTKQIERFADSRTCPAVEAGLARLDDLPSVTPHLPRLPTGGVPTAEDIEDAAGFMLDDIGYTIRMSGRSEPHASTETLTLSGGSYAPFAQIFVDALADLKICWTPDLPQLR